MGAQQGCCCQEEDANSQAFVPLSKASDEYRHAGAEDSDASFHPGEVAKPPAEKPPPEKAAQAPAPPARAAVPQLKIAGGEGHNGRAGALQITLDRSVETNIGLNLDALDEETAFVDGILPGAVDTWNRTHPDVPTLRPHDRIISVNNVSGETDRLLKEMRHTHVWQMVVDRPIEVKLRIDCRKFPSLGLDLKYSPNGGTLLIAGIGDGAIKDWNATTTGVKIEPRDRIVEVNNTRGTARHLLDTATDVAELQLTVLHYQSNRSYSP